MGFVRAQREKDRADDNAAQAETLARLTQRQLYVSDVNSAYHAWEEGNVDRARELLSRHAPQTGEEDLRGFEWRYLSGKYQRTMEIPTLQHELITAIAFSPDGAVLASSAWDGTDFDGDTDGDDFLTYQSQFGSGSGSASAAVPEPASIVLVLVLAAVGMFSRRCGIIRLSG